MQEDADIVVFGSGSFAARIVFDIAATASRPVAVLIAGRNAERVAWLKLAANARAVIYDRPARFDTQLVDLHHDDAIAGVIARARPRVVVQAASAQASRVIGAVTDAWSRLVREGGLSATAVFQVHLSLHVARVLAASHPACFFVNCCYPDVANELIAASGLPITCGIGNVAILAAAFAGTLQTPQRLRVLAQYQVIGPFRQPAETRRGPPPRVWLDETKIEDVYATFRSVKLTPEPVIDISGASGVPLMLAMAAGQDWRGHAPGPNGLPGGYPVALRDGVLDLDLPADLGRDEAIAWNAAFEAANGMVIGADQRVRYTGALEQELRAASPDLAAGFDVRDLEQVHAAMTALRARLQAQPA